MFPERQNFLCRTDRRSSDHRGKWNGCQILWQDSKKELLHAGITDDGDHTDIGRSGAGSLAEFNGQLIQTLADAVGQLVHLPIQCCLNSGDDIRSEGSLGIQHAGRSQLLSLFI